MVGSATSATAATQQNGKIPAPYIDPAIPSKAQQEANQINYDRVTLNDTATTSYLNTTAEQDKTVIEQQLEQNQELDPKTAGDFTFDNTTPLQWYVKNRISYYTQASDGSKGRGVLDIYVNPYSPEPTPAKKASTLTPSDPKASKIDPSNPKASIIGPSTKKKEDAEDIANKLFNKTIKLDPNFWLGKNIKDNQTQFKDAVVKDGILTQDEIQYVTWGNVNINIAGYFVNKLTFSVVKNGATATGSSTIDADSGLTTAQIAAKLTKASIYFNYTYWNKKTLQDNFALIQSILVNENILTKAEVSVVVGLASPVTINKAGIIDVIFKIDDNKTNTQANTKINVHNDGQTAQQVISTIRHEITLKTNTIGSYADNAAIEKYAVAYINHIWPGSMIQGVKLAHTLITAGLTKVPLTIVKDGQTATSSFLFYSAKNPITAWLNPFSASPDLKLLVNLSSIATKALQKYFQSQTASSSKYQSSLQYFFNLLDNGKWSNSGLPQCDNFGFPNSETIAPLLNQLGDISLTPLDKVFKIARNAGNKGFYNALDNYITKNVTNATIMFDIHFDFDSDTYLINQYTLW